MIYNRNQSKFGINSSNHEEVKEEKEVKLKYEGILNLLFK